MAIKRHGLTPLQIEVLEWIKAGQPVEKFVDDDDLRYRSHARRLEKLGLVAVSGRGDSWRVAITELGEQWPGTPSLGEPKPYRSARQGATSMDKLADHPPPDASVHHFRKVRRAVVKDKKSPIKVKQVQTKETFMRYRVQVTRVQVADRWVRATDEEDAAKKVQEEFDKPYGYFGSWKTTTSEVEVVEIEQTTVITPNVLSDEGPLLLSLKQASQALGLSYSMVYELVNQGELEHVKVASRKYVSREAVKEFIKANTHRGYR